MSTAIRIGADTVGAAVPTRRQEVHAAIRNGLIRPGADEAYAGGDYATWPPGECTHAAGGDGTWRGWDWPSLRKRVQVLGRESNLVDPGGAKPPLLFIH